MNVKQTLYIFIRNCGILSVGIFGFHNILRHSEREKIFEDIIIGEINKQNITISGQLVLIYENSIICIS